MSFVISPTKVLNSVVFSMFTKFWNLHPYLEHSITPIEAHLHQQLFFPQPLTTRNPLCVCGSDCSGRLSLVESHPVCPSVSASLPEHRVLRVRPRGSKCQGFSPFHRRMDHVFFIHSPLMGIRVFTPLGCCESHFCEHMYIPSSMDICFWFFGVCT